MKSALILAISALILIPQLVLPQPQQQSIQVTSKEFLQQLLTDKVYYFVSQSAAEFQATHRVEPELPRSDMMARVSGTVIVAFEISAEKLLRSRTKCQGTSLLVPKHNKMMAGFSR